jgi:hypothetical protein
MYTFRQQYPQANNSATIDNDVVSMGGNDFMVLVVSLIVKYVK